MNEPFDHPDQFFTKYTGSMGVYTDPALVTIGRTLYYTVLITAVIAILTLYHFAATRHFFRSLRIAFKRHILRHTIPVSVNYHFTRHCNAACKFCFHTELTSHHEQAETAKQALRLLYDAGTDKVNFAGGEPFLYPKWLGEMCQFAKSDLGLQSVSIVSNGTRIRREWFEQYAQHIDILAISCDSFNPHTNKEIGRADRGTTIPFDNVRKLFQVRDWCKEFGVKFKMNTVVCSLNWEEDMRELMQELDPFRWKVFQVLIVKGENEDEQRMRDARAMRITDEQFAAFCRRHEAVKGLTPEGNEAMKSSYLILDEYLRFLDKGDGGETHSASILDVGVAKALTQIQWDEGSFRARGGIYDWSRSDTQDKAGCGSGVSGVDSSKLEW